MRASLPPNSPRSVLTYASVYTLPITVGASQQSLQVQLDTGSSDLWLASTSCTSSVCSKSKLYDPSSALPTGRTFNITYLAGQAAGPIYWDTLNFGGYNIANQALAAVSSVSSEPLESSFNGVLGLALSANSIIQQQIIATDSNAPDGAIVSSNLFGITPAADAPAARFLSVSLQRPGMDTVPSLLGIGRHPAALVQDPAHVTYSEIVRSFAGELFWESSVRDITVWVNGTARPIALGRSTSGAVFPTAVLDTGVPYILSSTAIANALYGALGIGPGSDGQYYVPCDTPINMTITLDGQPAQPLHPLDLTAVPSSNPSATTCVGLIQTDGGALDSAGGVQPLPDVILGVAFLRNIYMVMAFDEPGSDGLFPNASGQDARPHLGMLGLTNITQALDEFNTVRVLGQPLTSQNGPASSTAAGSGHGLSVGVKVVIGLLAFIGLCAVLFGAFFLFLRRRYQRAGGHADAPEGRD
ncbi:aspartic peptidase domain-containing protein, partial [Vararia minispora EC-137]